jgi:hypothetical protein
MNRLPGYLLIAALLLAGCSSSPTSLAGGGTDFPNSHTTAAAMGKNLSDNISSGNQWGDSVALTDTVPNPSGGVALTVPSLPGVTAAAKGLAKATAVQTVTYDLSDTATLAIVRAFYALTSDSLMESDTLILLYDAAYRDSAVGSRHLYSWRGEKLFTASGLDQHYSYIDADGDSIINNRNGLLNRVAITWNSTDASGAMTAVALTIDGGADNDLSTAADNRILASSIGRFDKSGDTLSFTVATGYRGDSVVLDPRLDSGLVRVVTLDNTVAGKRTTGEAILVVFPADSTKDYTVYLNRETTMPGRTVFHRVKGVHADSLYFSGDSVFAERVVDSSLVSLTDTLRYIFIKGPNPLDNSGNRLLTLHRHFLRSAAANGERERLFTLTLPTSLAPDQEPASGPLYMRQYFHDGYWVQVDGSFTSQAITGDVTDSTGALGSVTWDRAGNVK